MAPAPTPSSAPSSTADDATANGEDSTAEPAVDAATRTRPSATTVRGAAAVASERSSELGFMGPPDGAGPRWAAAPNAAAPATCASSAAGVNRLLRTDEGPGPAGGGGGARRSGTLTLVVRSGREGDVVVAAARTGRAASVQQLIDVAVPVVLAVLAVT